MQKEDVIRNSVVDEETIQFIRSSTLGEIAILELEEMEMQKKDKYRE